jgi:hypothetical protein
MPLGCNTKEEPMNTGIKRVLFWTPRVLCILFALFLGWVALGEVFSEGYGFGETILTVLMALVPVYIVVIVLVIAWRWEWVGAILFTGLGVFYIVFVWARFRWSVTLVIAGLLVLVGVLFLFNWIYRAQLRTR